MQDQLDPQVVNLAKAIRQTESGGDFNIKGKSGEHGAYQFMPDTWDEYSREAGINVPLEKATPQQQNEVAYKKIKQWKDKGLNVGQIASSWNAGPGRPNAYIEGNAGINSKGVKYDTAAYAKEVADYYQNLKKQSLSQSSTGGPKPQVNNQKPLTFQDIQKTEAVPQPQQDLLSKTAGVVGMIPGVKDLGEGLSSSVAYAGEKIKGLFGGKDNSKFVPKTTEEEKDKIIKGGAKVSGLVGGLASLGAGSGLLAASKAKVLQSPSVVNALSKFRMPMAEFQGLSKLEKLNALGESLKTAGVGDAAEIAKAIKYLQPNASFVSKLLKGGWSIAKQAALVKILGDTVGGLVDRSAK